MKTFSIAHFVIGCCMFPPLSAFAIDTSPHHQLRRRLDLMQDHRHGILQSDILLHPNLSYSGDTTGEYLSLGAGHALDFHSWIVTGAFVLHRQPANDLALVFDPRHPPE
ncbi:hypothetical protein NSK_007430 [Nannochloropsis salina CCMP1776]|uniref:Uncharacterized protein n=1 Tax=Nannochloropsis salina CCMP1776 TaxID=1027361 RepID=A0A4D9CPZ6_9STRA|nr:hypothetical protein NSK_007430 [Nannochloropsis salina CCMP1776]|eukprot:TFJ81241.1 hypothetical protein NSK_007430 [Nannochloropsis salina CCMP1776]